MIDAESAIFDRIANVFDAAYPNGSRYGEPIDTPIALPCMTLVEIDNSSYENGLSGKQYASISYELNCYAHGKQEAKGVLGVIDEAMQNLGFYRTMAANTRNADQRIYRITARYSGVISDDYRIYRR